MGIIFGIVIALIVIFGIISMFQMAKEKSAYNDMIDAPSDDSVSTYISTLKNLNSNFVYRFSGDSFSANKRLDNRHRQTQGWNHIKNATTVSETKKNELKQVLNRCGNNVI